MDPKKYFKLVEEFGIIPTKRTITKIEIIVEALIFVFIIAAVTNVSGVSYNDSIVQITLTCLFGYVAGYLYRTYKLKKQLIDPEKAEDLMRGFGLVPPRPQTRIEKIIDAIIVIIIIISVFYETGAFG